MNNLDIAKEFKFVYLPVFYSNGSKCKLILLVDYTNHICDYRVIWEKFIITKYTTATHFNNPNQFRFRFRNKLLKLLHFEHIPNPMHNQRKSYVKINNFEEINNINNLFWNEWFGQTIPNISYILTGSNPSGENDPKQAEYWTKLKMYPNKKYAIGMFLDSIRYSKIWKFITNSTYLDKWNNFKQKKSQYDIISFENWLLSDKTSTYQRYLKEFNNERHTREEWKSLKEQLSNFKWTTKICESILSIAQKNRQIIRSIILGKYGNPTKFLTKFWDHDFSDERDEIEFAHIKSVEKCQYEACDIAIRDQNISDKAKEILNQIKDENNIIPLKHWYHRLFDTHNIYWEINGEIKISKSMSLDDKKFIIREKTFNMIPNKFLNNIKKYLQTYNDCLKNKKDFKSVINLIQQN